MRLPARLFLTGAAGFVLASCVADRAVAPVASVTGNPALRALVVAQTTSIVIPVNGGHISLFSVYDLDVPANAVCDMNAADSQAGYAAANWDAPCTAATSDVAVTATAKWMNGTLYVDFQPALRFVPSKSVTLSTMVAAPLIQSASDSKDGFVINYAPSIGAAPVADALTDPSVATKVFGSSGKVSRRIKHFSGYLINAGGVMVPCDPRDGDPQCVWVDDGES
jgi:hypothetical protein